MSLQNDELQKRAAAWVGATFGVRYPDDPLAHDVFESYLAGARAERERQQWMFDSWKREESEWIAENGRLRAALETAESAIGGLYPAEMSGVESFVLGIVRKALGRE